MYHFRGRILLFYFILRKSDTENSIINFPRSKNSIHVNTSTNFASHKNHIIMLNNVMDTLRDVLNYLLNDLLNALWNLLDDLLETNCNIFI